MIFDAYYVEKKEIHHNRRHYMRNMKPLILANSLRGFEIHARDGASGRIDDFYFNDQQWKVLHVVFDIGNWLTGRKVLLPPEVLGNADWRNRRIAVKVRQRQISESPDAEMVEPPGIWIDQLINRPMFFEEPYSGTIPEAKHLLPEESEKRDSHRLSVKNVKDCSIVGEDGKSIGRIQDFLIDTETWEIRFLLVKTTDSRIFLAPPEIVQSIDTHDRNVRVICPKEMKNDWQEYDPHYMALLEVAGC
jgi:sporulation protein YlmC with PRC-barrel domain